MQNCRGQRAVKLDDVIRADDDVTVGPVCDDVIIKLDDVILGLGREVGPTSGPHVSEVGPGGDVACHVRLTWRHVDGSAQGPRLCGSRAVWTRFMVHRVCGP